MSFITPLTYPFLYSRFSANHDKVEDFQPLWWNPYKDEYFFLVYIFFWGWWRNRYFCIGHLYKDKWPKAMCTAPIEMKEYSMLQRHCLATERWFIPARNTSVTPSGWAQKGINRNILFCSVQALGQAPFSSHQGNGPGKIANASLSGLALAASARGNNRG